MIDKAWSDKSDALKKVLAFYSVHERAVTQLPCWMLHEGFCIKVDEVHTPKFSQVVHMMNAFTKAEVPTGSEGRVLVQLCNGTHAIYLGQGFVSRSPQFQYYVSLNVVGASDIKDDGGAFLHKGDNDPPFSLQVADYAEDHARHGCFHTLSVWKMASILASIFIDFGSNFFD